MLDLTVLFNEETKARKEEEEESGKVGDVA